MAKKISLFFASLKEANALLFQSPLKFQKKHRNHYFLDSHNYHLDLYVTGIGKKMNLSFPKNLVHDSYLILKVGTCAVIDKNLPLGVPIIPLFAGNMTHNMDVSLKRIDDERIVRFLTTLQIDTGLLTLDHPLINDENNEHYRENNYTLVDMECFRLMQAFEGATIIPLLVGTDTGNKNAKKDFFKNLNTASHMLKTAVVDLLALIK